MYYKAELREILNKPFSTQRKELRRLSAKMFPASHDKIGRAMETCPIGSWDRNSYAKLRDLMSVPTMIGICAEAIAPHDLIDALLRPETYGHTLPNGNFEIGRPIGYTDDVHQETIAAINEDASYTLDDYISVFQQCSINNIPYTSTKEVLLKRGHSKDMVEGGEQAARIANDDTQFDPNNRAAMEISHFVQSDFQTGHDDGSEPEQAEPSVAKIEHPPEAQATLINSMMSAAKLPPVTEMIDVINALQNSLADAKANAKANAMAMQAPIPQAEKGDGTIPNGNVTLQRAHEVFGIKKGKELLDFDIPVWEWDAPHPHVPAKDPNYIFRPMELFRILYAIKTNQRCYMHGPTGCGKTTNLEQVFAYLNWPTMRCNFDSEITRMDLIGRDVLTASVDKKGRSTTISEFVEGILPKAMSGPYGLILDEIDFVRPDVAYVLQRALEGNGLMLTEDGGRMIEPHMMFRMFATGNTVGQGDEQGLYQGARPQSMALLDRFTVWIKTDYMGETDRAKLIKSVAPSMTKDMIGKLNQYVTEHLEAFTTAKVLQPLSPRGFMAWAKAYETFDTIMASDQAKQMALETIILDRATIQDRAVLSAIASRVFG